MAEDTRGDTEGVDISSLTSAGPKSNPYHKLGTPEFHGYKNYLYMTVSDLDTPIKVENDYYLHHNYPKPIPFLHQSVAHIAARYKNFKRVSAFDSKTKKYTDFANLHQPKHGHTEGGKGLVGNSRSVVFHGTGMSTINNIVIAMGCFPLANGYNTIETDLGVVDLGDVLSKKVNPTLVLTDTGEFAPILAISNTGTQKVFRFDSADGFRFFSTEDHPFFTMTDGAWLEVPAAFAFYNNTPIQTQDGQQVSLSNMEFVGEMLVGDISIPAPHRFVLNDKFVAHNCPASCSFCLSRSFLQNHYVLTEDGTKLTMSEIPNNIGVSIKRPDGTYTKITRWFENGLQEVFWYKDSDGDVIECTKTHKFDTIEEGPAPAGEIFSRNLSLKVTRDNGEEGYVNLVKGVSLGLEPTFNLEVEHPDSKYSTFLIEP